MTSIVYQPATDTPEEGFYFTITMLIKWQEPEMVYDRIPAGEVKWLAEAWGFTPDKIEALANRGKYNKKYNPSIDKGGYRLTKVFTK